MQPPSTDVTVCTSRRRSSTCAFASVFTVEAVADYLHIAYDAAKKLERIVGEARQLLRDLGVEDQARALAVPQDWMGNTVFCTSLAGARPMR